MKTEIRENQLTFLLPHGRNELMNFCICNDEATSTEQVCTIKVMTVFLQVTLNGKPPIPSFELPSAWAFAFRGERVVNLTPRSFPPHQQYGSFEVIVGRIYETILQRSTVLLFSHLSRISTIGLSSCLLWIFVSRRLNITKWAKADLGKKLFETPLSNLGPIFSPCPVFLLPSVFISFHHSTTSPSSIPLLRNRKSALTIILLIIFLMVSLFRLNLH
jgi:hypothetical protein